jgi:hypothetical protein
MWRFTNEADLEMGYLFVVWYYFLGRVVDLCSSINEFDSFNDF